MREPLTTDNSRTRTRTKPTTQQASAAALQMLQDS